VILRKNGAKVNCERKKFFAKYIGKFMMSSKTGEEEINEEEKRLLDLLASIIAEIIVKEIS
jgi:hypothetical protein